MRVVPAKEWNLRRKVLGNIVPILVGLPFGIWGVLLALDKQAMVGPPLILFALMPVSGWLMMNFVGLWQNGSMKKTLRKSLGISALEGDVKATFVGLARPSYRSILDPHEDVGFLMLGRDSLQFVGETQRYKLERKDLMGARFRANVHTMVGLGRWISIEGRLEETPIRLLIEPREKQTLLGNLRLSKRLLRKINTWIKDSGPRS